jgi:hypothetical protein
MVEIFIGVWTEKYVKENPNKLFIYNDNLVRLGKNGLSVARDLPNAIGIRTKKGPSKKNISFFTDSEYEENKKVIIEDIFNIKKVAIITGSTIVFSSNGYGVDDDMLDKFAPKTLDFLSNQLKINFGFDNKTRNHYQKIPSKSNIVNSKKIILNKTNSTNFVNILAIKNRPMVNNIDYIQSGIGDIHSLIKNNKKIAFSDRAKYNEGEIITIVVGNERPIICSVVESFPIKSMDIESWLIFEGFTPGYLNYNILTFNDKKLSNFQTHFRYICEIDEDGNILIGDNKLINSNIGMGTGDLDKGEEGEPGLGILTSEEYLKSVDDNIYKINGLKNRIISFFKSPRCKKNIVELIEDSGLTGDLFELSEVCGNENSTYYKLTNKYGEYYIEYNMGKYRNSIYICFHKLKEK